MRLSQQHELKKLHLQHHHMNANLFRFRTRALHLPKSIYALFKKVRSSEVCQATKQAPSRSRTSKPRSYSSLPSFLGTGEQIILLVIRDGTTTLLTAEAVNGTRSGQHTACSRRIQAFMTNTWEHFYRPSTSRPNRAKTAVRLFMVQLKIMLNSTRAGTALRGCNTIGVSIWKTTCRPHSNRFCDAPTHHQQHE